MSARWLAVLLMIVGVVLLAIAVLYFALPAQALPGFLGHIPGADVHRVKRGAVSLVLGVACLFVGMLIARRRARPASR